MKREFYQLQDFHIQWQEMAFYQKIHPEYETPYVSIIFITSTALIASIPENISQLVILSVFTILFCYLITFLFFL